MTTQEILQHFSNVKSRGNGQWQACCPTHTDNHQSLSITQAKDGKTMLKCHAGCATRDIISAVGLTMSDLFDRNSPCEDNKKKIVTEYIYSYTLKKTRYIDKNGKKTFMWSHLENNMWIPGTNNQTLPLYKQNTIDANNPVYIVEGEKDVHTLIDLGLTAVCAPHGASTNLSINSSKWLHSYTTALSGKDVIIIQDNDDIGKSFANSIADNLLDYCNSIKVIDLTLEFKNLKLHDDTTDAYNSTSKIDFLNRLTKLIQLTNNYSLKFQNQAFSPLYNKELYNQILNIKPELKYQLNDKGIGELFADVNKNLFRFNATSNEWFYYDGKIWSEDVNSMRILARAKELADVLYIYALALSEGALRKSYIDYISKLGQLRYRKTMIEDSRDKYFITKGQLDKNPLIFNCQNGILNLKTFEFVNHSAEYLLSKISNVVYNPDIVSNKWINFIDDVTCNDIEKAEYLQKILGYGITADTSVEACFIFFGASTRNGKSTLIETIAYLLGNTAGYAMTTSPETIAQKQSRDSRQASGNIARLDGCRFLSCSEFPKRMVIDVALLKQLLGRDTITARHLHEREFEFIPVYKLFINTNFLPVITDDTLFSSGRLQIVTFDRHFKPEEQDRTLKDILRTPENISGIFNWLLNGLKKYYESNIVPPESVVAATQEYRANSDKLGQFIAECLVAANENCKAIDVYKRYQDWCEITGHGCEYKGIFFEELRNRNLLLKSGTVNGKTYRNILKNYSILYDF